MRKQLVQTFLDLVKIDSPTGSEDGVCQFLIKRLHDLGLSPYIDGFGNIIVKKTGFGKPLLLSAHVDTVEPGRNIHPVVEAMVIKSDGTTILGADNKVGLAIILTIFDELVDKSLPHRALEVVFTRSEEIGNYGAVNLDYSQLCATSGYIFDNPNPVGTIITSSPFYNRFDITIQGKEAHASKPEQAIAVLPILTKALQDIPLGRVSETAVTNIGVIQGGEVRNTILGKLSLKGEVRSFVEGELEELTNNIRQAFDQAADSYGGFVTTAVVRENSGYTYNKNNKVIQRLASLMRQQQVIPSCVQDWGCSDANIFAEHGIQVINLGDGCVATHTTEEQIKIIDMVKLKEIVSGVVLKL